MNTETTQALAPVRQFTALMPSSPRGAHLARRAVVRQLMAWERPYERAEHVVAELASNAVRHGHVPGRNFRLTLRLAASGVLRVEVSDTCAERLPRAPGPGPVDPDAESGRGLLIVAAIADRWGTEFGPDPRKTVWAELDSGR
ncbi:ATP-binding protein [Streptomyces sp. AN091965]|uniref:ATP-binding protein n=1 Tax=Streptomyces sp. AN091965 TaxID=2927803 RepID=UPI001F611C34|nr:ATP-binding protein [Streptomyces sp. AN091965]MCI3930997.1 ATP-binding protein [Streptomyces sp. AN091965]